MTKKRKAFAYIQSLIVFMLVILIVSISITLINYNYLKANTFKSYSDKKAITIEEELILKEINKSDYETKLSNKYGNYEFLELNREFYLVRNGRNTKAYLLLEIKEKGGKKYLVPTCYKTEDIVIGK